MKAQLKRLLSIGLASMFVVVICGCSQQAEPDAARSAESSEQSSLQPSEPQSSSAASSELIAPPAELKEAGVITVYRAYPNTEIFEPFRVEVDKATPTLLDIIKETEKVLDMELPILSVTQQKGMVTINLASSFISARSKREIYPILSTVGMTLKENHQTLEWVVYQIDGETGMLGEKYPLPALNLLEGAPEEFAAIRAKVPYEGLEEVTAYAEYDKTGNKIAEFLSRLEPLDKDIQSVKELDNQYILRTSIFNTQYYTTNAEDSEREHYCRKLKPMEGPVSEKLGLSFTETMFWLQEHVEQTAKLIFGDTVTLKHENLKIHPYRYFATEGVYTPPHMGAGHSVRPYILGYEDQGDSYKVTATYIFESEAGYIDPDALKQTISQEEVDEYAKTKCRKREIILKKAEEGSLRFVSHRFLP